MKSFRVRHLWQYAEKQCLYVTGQRSYCICKRKKSMEASWKPRFDLRETLCCAVMRAHFLWTFGGRMVASESKLCNLHTLPVAMPVRHSEGICLLTKHLRWEFGCGNQVETSVAAIGEGQCDSEAGRVGSKQSHLLVSKIILRLHLEICHFNCIPGAEFLHV